MEEMKLLARAVEEAVFRCLMNAWNDQANADRWFKQADRLESKFKNEPNNIMKKHYSEFL